MYFSLLFFTFESFGKLSLSRGITFMQYNILRSPKTIIYICLSRCISKLKISQKVQISMFGVATLWETTVFLTNNVLSKKK